MTYCKKFINGISTINFTEESVLAVKNNLLAFAYQDLKKQAEELARIIKELPKEREDNRSFNTQLTAYKKQHAALIVTMQLQMLALAEAAHPTKIDTEVVIDNPPAFVAGFANNFRNIKHLADTLSDAPPAIKNLQTLCYVEILSKLEPAEQEIQLQTLSVANMQDMIEQAVKMHDSHPDDTKLQNQCQRLVQMAYYEIVRRDCAKVPVAESVQYVHYQEFLAALRNKLPQVGTSKILDNLSEFRDTSGKTIFDQLATVETNFKIPQKGDWEKTIKIDAIKERKAFFHHLRFGQEDRREYAKKVQVNLTRDLFWGRNIRDVELFTKSTTSDKLFTAMAENRYLETDETFKNIRNPTHKVPANKVYSKLEEMIINLNDFRVNSSIPVGDLAHKLSKEHERLMKAQIVELMKNLSKVPTVSIADGVVSVTCYNFVVDDAIAGKLLNTIIKAGGFNSLKGKLVDEIVKKALDIFPNLQSQTFVGSSLQQVTQQIGEMDYGAERTAYLAGIRAIQTEVQRVEPASSISKLGLDPNSEILLCKLLELSSVHNIKAVRDKYNAPTLDVQSELTTTLGAAFVLIKAGKYKDALANPLLDAAVGQAYEKISTIPLLGASEKLAPIIKKGQIITTSAQERLAKSLALDAAFASQKSIDLKIKDVAKIFEDEYVAMAPTLGLSEHQIAGMKEDILVMATEMVHLLERTKHGEMAVTEIEHDAYFAVIQQIAAKIDVDINDVRFKVNSSTPGKQTITIIGPGQVKSVDIDLGDVSLPYTLIKPVGGNFIFSYGGSRGVIAPFAGIDDSVKGKRFFTHSKLLGVGQYGSVKEVEHVLTGLNQVVKKGYVPAAQPTFTDESRSDLRTRPITARDDPLYRIESDVLQNLSKAEKAKVSVFSGGTQYWIEQDKARTKGTLFTKTGTPEQYQILTERAKGDTLADTANRKLNLFTKADPSYHDPVKRKEGVSDLKDMVALSVAIIAEAQKFAALKFSHNDIKPENFLYKKNPDGSYEVRYIDWATGGFEQAYAGTKTTIGTIFAEVFGDDLPNSTKGTTCSDANGRFVTANIEGTFTVGVKPTLEILHGARNGTLPYISPKVLGEDRDKVPVSGKDARLTTVIEDPKDPYMDDWALTAMTFGVCNRQAYFTLVKGRVVSDYVVPNVLDSDGGNPPGLKIVNLKNFNDQFACGGAVSQEDFASGAVYTKTDAVMFIPGNQREGEPLHLYRRLQNVKDILKAKIETADVPADLKAEAKIVKDIDDLLTDVRRVMASGAGYTKSQLIEKMDLAQQCIENYEKLSNVKHQQAQARRQTLEKVLRNAAEFAHSEELLAQDEGVSLFEILCTYPTTPDQVEGAIAILTRIMPEASLNDLVIEGGAPTPRLFRDLIEQGQNKIACHMLGKISKANPDFIAMVKKDGLLHYAAEKGMTDVVTSLVAAMKLAGASNDDVFAAMMAEYGPGARIKTAPHIKWASNCFHISIRNNNAAQLKVVLDHLPAGTGNDELIKKALHLAASFGNTALFKQIVDRYNIVDADKAHQIDAEKILGMLYPPDGTSPYHWFIRQPETQGAIDWEALEAKAPLAKAFLLVAPEHTEAYPMLIAARNGNFSGVERLVQLGVTASLSAQQWDQFFTQKDEYGKSVLNYALEQGKVTYFSQLLDHINAKCSAKEDVLVFLASNPHPNNPLQNYLSFEKNEKQQFKVVSDLLNGICSDFATAKKSQQDARIAALLVNEDWLTTKAQNVNNHASLKSLLQNHALSIPYKAALFARLSKDTPLQDGVAKKFFDDLLLEVTPRLDVQPQKVVSLDIPFPIMQEVARQKADLNSLIKALGMDGEELLERLSQYEKEFAIARKEMSASQEALKEADFLIRSTTNSLKDAQLLGERLSSQISTLKAENALKIQELERQIESLTAAGGEALEKAKRDLDSEKNNHVEALSELQAQVQDAESTILDLRTALEEQGALLVKEKQVNQALRGRVGILESENLSLRTDLDSTILLGKREKAEFLEELQKAQAQVKGLGEEVVQVRGALVELGQVRDGLQLRVDQLGLENDALKERVGTLENEVARYKEQLTDVGERLGTEQRAVKSLKHDLGLTTQALEKAEGQREELRVAIVAQEVDHGKKVQALEGQVDLVRAQGGKALEEAQRALDTEKSEHALKLQGLEGKLEQATLLTDDLQRRLDAQSKVLAEKDGVILGLRQEVAELGDVTQRLRAQVLETQSVSEAEKGKLSDALGLAQAQVKGLGEEVVQVRGALVELGQVRDGLQLRVDQLGLENSRLQELLQEKDQALEREKAIGQGKDQEILRLQALLGQVLQQKAEQALLRVVEQSRDPELVHNVAKATNPQQLLNIGLSDEDVNALIKFKDQIVGPKVVEAGKVRSAQLEEIAINQLKGEIARVVDPDFLYIIAAANSNSDLQGIGLDDGYVAGLWKDSAFQPLKEQAHRQLLAIETRALDALLLEVGSADEGNLKKIVLVTSNEGLKAAGLNATNVDALYRPEAHTFVVENAKLLLAAIELRKQQQAQLSPVVDHAPKKAENEGVDLDREARERELALARERELALALERELALERDRQRERPKHKRERDSEVDKENTPPKRDAHTTKKKVSESSVFNTGHKPKRKLPKPHTVDDSHTTTRDGTSSALVTPVQPDAPTVPSPKIKIILVEQEGILEFTEGRVAANKFKQDLPVAAEQLQPGNELVALKMDTSYYQGALIGRDEVVRACKVYKDEPKNKAVGLLVQDCRGKITDYSYGSLTKEQETEIAFKQSQMMLANYRAEDGDLIIRGKNAEKADMLFAALLVLKGAHPDLKHVQIKSWVSGCKGPEYIWHTRDSVTENNYIQKHLLGHTVTAEAQNITKQLDELTRTRQKRFKDMYAILKQTDKTSSQKEEELNKYSLHDGDKLGVTGKVIRVDPEDTDSHHHKR